MTRATIGRLAVLSGFLEADPDNLALLADAGQTALDDGNLDRAAEFMLRLRQLSGGGVASSYLEGMLAMRRREFADAAAVFARLMANEDSPVLRFNRAWALAMIGEKNAALELLNDVAVGALAGAAMLKLQLVHEAGEFPAAAAFAEAMLPVHGDDPGFLSAVSVLALDLENVGLARECAERAGNHPEALATLGTLALGEADAEVAMARFDRALAIRQHHPRAWIGRGLAQLALKDCANAAIDIDRGAGQFGDHIGSWIAAGWAHFLTGERDISRERFDRALAIDHSFAESHGSLAVLDVVAGDRESAKRRVAIALRLDRQCFAAALAQALLAADDPERADAIIQEALNTPLNEAGMTISSYMKTIVSPTVH